jgi:hypothetical protein
VLHVFDFVREGIESDCTDELPKDLVTVLIESIERVFVVFSVFWAEGLTFGRSSLFLTAATQLRALAHRK